MTLKQFVIVFAAISGLLQSSVLAQSRAAPEPPVFEVASIKLSGAHSLRGSDGGPGSEDPGRYIFNVASLRDLIVVAWNVRPFQISSPAPLDRQTFDLMAKVPEGTTKQLFRLMLQNLLADRFGLKVHIESREFPAYELVVAKSGLKLKETIPGETTQTSWQRDSGWPELSSNVSDISTQHSLSGGFELVRLKAQLEPLSALVQYLPTPDNLPVVDKTGLTGKYSFTLEYTRDIPGGAPDAPPTAPALFTALQQQLGLHLVSKKLPFDVVVVESFNKLPTEN